MVYKNRKQKNEGTWDFLFSGEGTRTIKTTK